VTGGVPPSVPLSFVVVKKWTSSRVCALFPIST